MATLDRLQNPSVGHARLGPSGAKRWMACPGSVVLESQFPNSSSIYSDEGTACHDIAARCLTGGLRARSFVGEYIVVSVDTEPRRTVLFDSDMAELTQTYVDNINAMVPARAVLWVEERVDISECLGVPEQFGTADAVVLQPYLGKGARQQDVELCVHDAKFGRTPVGIDTPQLPLYALGMIAMLLRGTKAPARGVLPDIEDEGVDSDKLPQGTSIRLPDGRYIRQVRVFIHQPKLRTEPFERTISIPDILAFGIRAGDAARKVIEAVSARTPTSSPTWQAKYINQNPTAEECAFCRAMSVCPSAAERVRSMVTPLGAITDLGAEVTKPKWDFADIAVLDKYMQAAPLIEDWLHAVRSEMERRLLAGEQSTEFGLELGRRGARAFTDLEAVEDVLRKKYRLRVSDIYNLKLKTPAQMEELTKPAVNPMTGEEEPAVLGETRWARLQEFIKHKDAKPSVKPRASIKTEYQVPPPAALGAVADDDDLY